LATFFNPVAPIIGAIVMTIVFVSGFALHPTGRARAAGGAAELDERAPAKDMFTGGVFVVVLGVFGVGMVFGSTLTALTALTNDIGRPAAAGLLYGVMGIGSAVRAISVAALPSSFTLWARLLCFSPIMVVGSLLLASTESMPIIVVALLLMGSAIGPSLVTLFSLAAERSPRGRSATVMSRAGSAIIVGQSVSSPMWRERPRRWPCRWPPRRWSSSPACSTSSSPSDRAEGARCTEIPGRGAEPSSMANRDLNHGRFPLSGTLCPSLRFM